MDRRMNGWVVKGKEKELVVVGKLIAAKDKCLLVEDESLQRI